MQIVGFEHIGGKHCETTALRKVLRHGGCPWSEELLLGIGGGVGFIYWHTKSMPVPFIGTRAKGGKNFIAALCKRVGIEFNMLETSNEQRGHRALLTTLERGRPAIVYGDMAYLPYFHASDGAHFGGHAFVVFGIDGESVDVSDRAVIPLQIPAEDLRRARSSRFQPMPPRNRILSVARAPEELPEILLTGSLLSCAEDMLKPPISNLGVKGMYKWAKLIGTAWGKLPPTALYAYLCAVFVGIETGGTGGQAFRSMYAAFVKEAAERLKSPELASVAAKFSASACAWSQISEASLPSWSPELARTRYLLLERNRHFEDQGPGSAVAMDDISRELAELRIQATERLDAGTMRNLLVALEAEVRACALLEEQALQALYQTVSQRAAA